jgi:hypothetical protein
VLHPRQLPFWRDRATVTRVGTAGERVEETSALRFDPMISSLLAPSRSLASQEAGASLRRLLLIPVVTVSSVPWAGAVAGACAAKTELAAALSDTDRQRPSCHLAEGMETKLANGETPAILRSIRRPVPYGGTRWSS